MTSLFDQFPDPKLIIIGGPNGSGKTTLTRTLADDKDLPMKALNADDLAKEMLAADPNAENVGLQTAIATDAALDDHIERKESVLVETVLSSKKYRERVTRAKENGMFVLFIYVTLDRPELNVARVSQRVNEGGHNVPTDKVIERYHKSMNEAISFFAIEADACVFYENTNGPAELFSIYKGVLTLKNDARAKELFPNFDHLARQ